MLRRIGNITDVVDWGLCVGCGACNYACSNQAVTLQDIESVGIRPVVNADKCTSDCDCLSICPGYSLDGYLQTGRPVENAETAHKFGPALEIWQGHTSDVEIRHAASSGGVLTALALYCLEQENMEFVLHSGMDPERPYTNKTVRSQNRQELLSRTGSRYAPASPCDRLEWVEESARPAVFIGKPCDAAAVSKLCHTRSELDEKIGLILTFFCAGTPSTAGTLELIEELGASPERIDEVRYRGQGWPGAFRVRGGNMASDVQESYEASWGKLQSHRPFRCHLCPDGTGQIADISSGDAWHAYNGNGNPGLSLILIRTERGRRIFHEAVDAGYIEATPSSSKAVLAAQKNLLQRREQIWGRLLGMMLTQVPTPNFKHFGLIHLWFNISLIQKIRTVVGTLRRIILRGFWRRGQTSFASE